MVASWIHPLAPANAGVTPSMASRVQIAGRPTAPVSRAWVLVMKALQLSALRPASVLRGTTANNARQLMYVVPPGLGPHVAPSATLAVAAAIGARVFRRAEGLAVAATIQSKAPLQNSVPDLAVASVRRLIGLRARHFNGLMPAVRSLIFVIDVSRCGHTHLADASESSQRAFVSSHVWIHAHARAKVAVASKHVTMYKAEFVGP